MTADPPGQRRSLTGRAAELALIEEFLDRAAAEAVLGARRRARGRQDRAAAGRGGSRHDRGNPGGPAEGVEFETTGVFSGLSQILIPLSAGLETLLPAHRDTLAVVLGVAEGDPPKPPQVAQAALNIIRGSAARRPLLLVVDDLQWMDRSSADVLSFVVRRLGGSRAGFLAAARTGSSGVSSPQA